MRVGLPSRSPGRWGAGQSEFPPASNVTRRLEGCVREPLTMKSAQVSGLAPGGEDKIFQGFTLAGSDLLSEQLLVAQVRGFALIAEGDDGAQGVTLGYCKGSARSGLVEAGHLVGGEAKRGGLQGEIGAGGAQVIEGNTVRGIVVGGCGLGGAQDQHRGGAGPGRVEG